MAFGPSGEFGHTLEASIFVQARRLKVVRRNPNPSRASSGCLGNEGIQQRLCMASAPMGFLDPHQFELGDPRPGIAGGNADGTAGLIAQRKDETPVVIAAGEKPVVAIEVFLDGVELGRRKIVLGLQARGHQIPPYQS